MVVDAIVDEPVIVKMAEQVDTSREKGVDIHCANIELSQDIVQDSGDQPLIHPIDYTGLAAERKDRRRRHQDDALSGSSRSLSPIAPPGKHGAVLQRCEEARRGFEIHDPAAGPGAKTHQMMRTTLEAFPLAGRNGEHSLSVQTGTLLVGSLGEQRLRGIGSMCHRVTLSGFHWQPRLFLE